ncbi:ATP-binding cassette domain-containing protein [Mycobacterium simiae]|uniref:ATP-binding cassette domain-containing protein n=1 Tax=Mycobacterium simiae TaxID=1784 RepID=A0A5B1BSS8_MYCSI|nr:ABC transporter permease [Mycobacterium simiae]KAA1251737.1 ATP-binding cassette domain-containing protein [Mycobacterium simiae]
MRYVFAPGRDVLVGRSNQFDIHLSHPGPADQPTPDVVLRSMGTHWVAIDGSGNGIFVGGARLSAIDILDGQTIAIGDPQHGPRLTFQIAAASGRPDPPRGQKCPSATGHRPNPTPPTEQVTQRVPAEPASRRISAPAHSHLASGRTTTPIRLTPSDRPPAPGSAQAAVTPKQPTAERLPSTNRLPLKPGARTIGVAAFRLGFAAAGHDLLSEISFSARPGSLIAIIGPSRPRNAALIGLLAGTRPLSSGVLTVDGHDVDAEPELMRSRIGVVPRDNRVHRLLTVEQALGYAAEMRLPPDTSPENRHRVVNQVLDELELTPHRRTRVANLAPELRRCLSVAIELITRPSLLVVDEPAAGPNPAQQSHVMAMLRRQADLGCVVVATMSLAHVHLCDQVLLLTPAGTLAFAGPPAQIESVLGTSDWSEASARVSANPGGAHQAFLNRQPASVSVPPAMTASERPPAVLAFGRQVALVARRQVRLLAANRAYLAFLSLLPFALGALTLLIPGDSGLDRPDRSAGNPHEAIAILAALNVAAVLMGTVLTAGDLVSERRIFRREQSVGLSASAYLIAKIMVFGLVAAIQAAILTAIVVTTKGRPAHGAVLLHSPTAELYVGVAATAIVSAIIGLALSTLGRHRREVLPLVVPVILASALFAGGLVTLAGTWGFDQISWFVPGQWGFAATASTVELRRVDALAAHNAVWAHYPGWWLFDMAILIVLGALWAAFARYRLRAPTTSPSAARE